MNALAYSFLSQRQGILGRAENLLSAAIENRSLERECFARGETAEAARYAKRRRWYSDQLARMADGPRGMEVRQLLKSIGGH